MVVKSYTALGTQTLGSTQRRKPGRYIKQVHFIEKLFKYNVISKEIKFFFFIFTIINREMYALVLSIINKWHSNKFYITSATQQVLQNQSDCTMTPNETTMLILNLHSTVAHTWRNNQE